MRFCLTATILDGYSAAFSIMTSEWYNMVFDVHYDTAVNLPHELWHSTESFIADRNYSLFSDENWAALNPGGFAYTVDYENYLYNDDTYCYPYEDWYFIDIYGKVNAREDRARIMEIIMSPEKFNSDHYLTSPHIRQKLEVMCAAIRSTFDTTGWNGPLWERYGE